MLIWFGQIIKVRFWTNWFWVGTQLQPLINLPLNPLKTTGQNSIPRKMFKLLINIPRQLTDILNPNLDEHFRVSFFDGAENSKSIPIWDLLELPNWFETSQDQKIWWRTESCIWCYMASWRHQFQWKNSLLKITCLAKSTLRTKKKTRSCTCMIARTCKTVHNFFYSLKIFLIFLNIFLVYQLELLPFIP